MCPCQALRKSEQLGEPVEHVKLELRRGRRDAPDERDLVQRRGQQLGEDRRLARGYGEVAEEARALPVRDRRQDQLVEIAEHVCEGLSLLGRRRGERPPQVARSQARKHWELADALEIAGRPLESRRTVRPEVGAHGRLLAASVSHCSVFAT